MTLTDPSDEELNAAFAEKVCGYTKTNDSWFQPGGGALARWVERGGAIEMLDDSTVLPPFTQSADAVLPWLEKQRWVKGEIDRDQDCGVYVEGDGGLWHGCDEDFPFPKRCVIALLRKAGVRVIFIAE